MAERQYDAPSWDFYNLLDRLGSVADVRQIIDEAGYNVPPRETVQGWRSRNAVPGCWVPVLIQVGLDRGLINRVDDLLIAGKADDDDNIFD